MADVTVADSAERNPATPGQLEAECDALRDIIRANLGRFDKCPCRWCEHWRQESEEDHCIAGSLTEMRLVKCEWIKED